MGASPAHRKRANEETAANIREKEQHSQRGRALLSSRVKVARSTTEKSTAERRFHAQDNAD
jgi:hypothetical protein